MHNTDNLIEPITYYPYGTSGFRFDENIMQHIAYDIGRALGVLLIKGINKKLGVMITASHNIYTDNGVKIIDESGYMIQSLDEQMLEELVNHKKDFTTEIDSLTNEHNLLKCNVILIIGNDTRRSCDNIKSLIITGASEVLQGLIKFSIVDQGLCTTPEFHFIVPQYTHNNINVNNRYITQIKDIIYEHKINLSNIVIDCANGVGSNTFKKIFDDEDLDFLTIHAYPTLINTSISDKEKLNNMCGSDYITNSYNAHHSNLLKEHNNQSTYNDNYDNSDNDDMLFRENMLHVSLDGDADRLIFYSYDKTYFRLMTGDHISILILKYIINVFTQIVIETEEYIHDNCHRIIPITSKQYMNNFVKNPVTITVVHTGYSNGGFMKTVDDMIFDFEQCLIKYDYPNIVKIDRIVTPTGVKNLIDVAKNYNVGIYFEQNGHGSVLINDDRDIIDLKVLKALFNQLIGDAVMNLIGVSYLLKKTKTSIVQFKNLFKDRESELIKIHVKNKNIYKTNHDQSQLLEPVETVNAIGRIMNHNAFKGCRAFVRPSGTEDVLRLYVENDPDNNANLEGLITLLKRVLI